MLVANINPENWVHEKLEVTIDTKAGQFTLWDETYILVETHNDEEFQSFDIFHLDDCGVLAEFRSGWVNRSNFLGKGWDQWEAYRDELMTRTDKDSPFIAAAKLMSNLI